MCTLQTHPWTASGSWHQYRRMRESVALWGSQSRGGIAKPVVVVFLWIAEEGIVESKNMFRFGMSSQARPGIAPHT